MAGNKVTLTFAGDSSDLERSLNRVGSSAEGMGRKANDQAGKLDRLGEAGGNAETRMLGLGAGISGLKQLFSENAREGAGAADYAMALADIGDSIEHTVIPAIRRGVTAIRVLSVETIKSAAQHVASAATTVASWVAMGVQATINAVKMAAAWLISLGPIGLVIAAIGAVIGILMALGIGFDDIKRFAEAAWNFILGAAQGVFNWLQANWPLVLAILTGPIGLAVLAIQRNWDTIKNGFTAVKDWISARVEDIVSFITGIPGRIASAASSIGSTIINGIKSGISSVGGFVSDIGGAIKRAINSALHLPFTIHGPGPLPDFTIPAFHTGGVFHAPSGEREGLAMLLDGERVLRPGESGGGGVVTVRLVIDSGSNPADRALMEMLRERIRVEHGGSVQAALGFSR